MPNTETPSFPRGFLLSETPVEAPESYAEGPILPHFFVHPWARVEAAGDVDQFVIVVGLCVSTTSTEHRDVAADLLGSLQAGEGGFLSALDDYCGRHAIIYGSRAAPKIVTDATAMRAVFYAPGVAASHAILVERIAGAPNEVASLPHGYGYPGNHTPYATVRLLTPNTYLDLHSGVAHRFWPTGQLPHRTVDEVAEQILTGATNAMQCMGEGRTVKVALTAGLDSRTVFAVALNSGVAFDAYTYGIAADTAVDRAFAADLAHQFGVRHVVPTKVAATQELQQQMDLAHYSMHHKRAVPSLMGLFGDPSAVAVTANLLEIGRSFYLSARHSGFESPSAASAMTALHMPKKGNRKRPVMEEYGMDRFHTETDDAFQGLIDDTNLRSVEGILDPFDQFYWEHRMSAWHGAAMVERDFYAEPFIPFNSRSILAAMLSVPQEERDTSAVFYRMIEKVDPRLLDLPVNPKQWPLPAE